jgi:hypothetical protein
MRAEFVGTPPVFILYEYFRCSQHPYNTPYGIVIGTT